MYLFGVFISLSIPSLICLFLYLFACLSVLLFIFYLFIHSFIHSSFVHSFIIGLLQTRLISKNTRTLNDAEWWTAPKNMAQTPVFLAYIREVLESKYALDPDKLTEFFHGFPQYLWQILGQSRIIRRSFPFTSFLIHYSPVTPYLSTMFTD
jgi:hypothetical protein